jgi:hypothetical protein
MDWDPDFLARSPMFEPLRALGGVLARPDWPARTVLQNLLERDGNPVMTCNDLPLRLVPAGGRMRSFEERYEARIHLRGEMIFRERNWHDLLNVLAWLTFPRAKAALNARHYAALRSQDAAGAANRGPAQDALTLFDEGGVIVASCDDELLGLLRGWRWKELFWSNRTRLQGRMCFYLFGHALYEKALRPFIGRVEAWSRGPVLRGCDGGDAHEPTISPDALQPTPGSHLPPQRQALLRRPSATGRGILLKTEPALLAQPPREQLAVLDSQVAATISKSGNLTAPRELAVVPVLGVPGWCPGNEQESYYDNTDYFRPGRRPEGRRMK